MHLIFHIILVLAYTSFHVNANGRQARDIEFFNGGDVGCTLDAATERIQIAIAADITNTNYKHVRDVFSSKSTEILDAVNAIHKDTEFAITTHANWEDSAWRAGHTDPNGCYTLLLNFTTDVKTITKVAQSIGNLPGPAVQGKKENAIPALCFAVSDKKIGWVRGSQDNKGRNVHRFILLFTDVFSIFNLHKPGSRTKFRADGTDTCQTSLPPTQDEAGRILRENNIIIIGAYVNMTQSSYKEYQQFYKKYRVRNTGQIFDHIDHLNKEIVDFISTSVKAQLQCLFGDPEGFNTLGL